jgi:tetratricopeptide (TPR) repeat protein
LKRAFEHTYYHFPTKNKSVENLADYYFSVEAYDKAFEILEKQQKRTGSDINYISYKGRYFFVKNNLPAAIKEYEKIAHLSYFPVDAKYRLARSYDRTGNIKKALEYYAETIKTKQFDFDNHTERARKRMKELQAIASPQIIALKKAVQDNPNNLNAYAQLGVAQEENLMYEEAILTYTKILNLGGENWALYFNLGNVYKKVGKYDKATTNYKKSISLNNKYADTYNNLGTALKKSQDYDAAIEATKTAIEINPNLKEAYYNLATLYYKIGDEENALKYFNYVLKNYPEMENDVALYMNDLK